MSDCQNARCSFDEGSFTLYVISSFTVRLSNGSAHRVFHSGWLQTSIVSFTRRQSLLTAKDNLSKDRKLTHLHYIYTNYQLAIYLIFQPLSWESQGCLRSEYRKMKSSHITLNTQKLILYCTTDIYSWSQIQLIPNIEIEVERISQQPQQTQTNPKLNT